MDILSSKPGSSDTETVAPTEGEEKIRVDIRLATAPRTEHRVTTRKSAGAQYSIEIAQNYSQVASRSKNV